MDPQLTSQVDTLIRLYLISTIWKAIGAGARESSQNFSANPFRRIDLTVPLSGTDPESVGARLRHRLGQIPHLLDSPAPVVEILSFGLVGTSVAPVLAVRPCCRNEHYAQVYFDTTRAIQEICVQQRV